MDTAAEQRRSAQRADIVTAAVRAIEAGLVGDQRPLSRRNRWTLLDLSANPDRAVVAVAIRNKRNGLRIETYVFERTDDGWLHAEQGPGQEFEGCEMPSRFAGTSGGTAHSFASTRYGPGPADEQVGLWHLNEQAVAVRTRWQTRAVPDHGWVVTIGSGASTAVEVLDSSDSTIGRVRLAESRVKLPLRWRLARRRFHRWPPGDGGWFNYAPRERAGLWPTPPRIASRRGRLLGDAAGEDAGGEGGAHGGGAGGTDVGR